MPTFQDNAEAEEDVTPRIHSDEIFDGDIVAECANAYTYIFVVDKSATLGHHDRMLIIIESLKLAIKSLPYGSTFQILKVGTKFTYMKNKKASPLGLGVLRQDALFQYTDAIRDNVCDNLWRMSDEIESLTLYKKILQKQEQRSLDLYKALTSAFDKPI